MKLNKKIIASMIVASLGAAGLASTAMAASNSATGTAVIATAITIGAPVTNLSFGILSDTGAGGTATVDGTGAVAGVTGGTTFSGGTASAAEFAIGGTASANYTIDLTASTAVLTHTVTPANTMGITYTAYSLNDSVGTNYDTAYNGTNATLDATNADTIRVGGTLTVGAGQAAGTYTGTVNVTVLYQ